MAHHWTHAEIADLFALSFPDLLWQAQTVHRQHHNPNHVQVCRLLNVKTGACPENCSYCSQSGHYDTGLQKEKLWDLDEVVKKIKDAKANGATRFCLAGAWRNLPEKDLPKVIAMVQAINNAGLTSCLTAGMLTREQAHALKDAGLHYYNHNLDTSESHYKNIVSTRTYADRIATLTHVAQANLGVCCGGILGMGETESDRIELLLALQGLPKQPGSVTINSLVHIPGTPLENQEKIDPLDIVRMVAVTRIMFPSAMVRLCGGRNEMSDAEQTLCFLAGANSIFSGGKSLTTPLPSFEGDYALFAKLGVQAKPVDEVHCA